MQEDKKIQNMFVDAISDYTDSDAFKEVVKSEAVKACNDIVHSCLEQYSRDSSYEALKKKISECLQIGIEGLNIQSFSHMVTSVIEEGVNKKTQETLNKTLLPFLQTISGQTNKESVKLSEIVEVFKNSIKNDCAGGADIQIDIQERSGYKSTSVDYKSFRLHHEDTSDELVFEVCLERMTVSSFGDSLFNKFPNRAASYLPNSILWYIFTLMINRVKIEIDLDDCDFEMDYD